MLTTQTFEKFLNFYSWELKKFTKFSKYRSLIFVHLRTSELIYKIILETKKKPTHYGIDIQVIEVVIPVRSDGTSGETTDRHSDVVALV